MAVVPELEKAMVSVPPEDVNVAKVRPPDCKLPPLTVKLAPVRSNPNSSAAHAPPLRCTVSEAPVQVVPSSASTAVTSAP